MDRLSFSILCLFFLFLFSVGEINSQVEGLEKDVKFSESSRARFDEIESNIKRELGELKNHKWAGEYSYGDGLGINVSIRLAPKSGFIFTWVGCLGLYDLNYGKIEEKDGKIIFLPELPNKREGFQGIDTEFYTVLWGERRYLIPVRKMVKFINKINSGFEPRSNFSGFFPLRNGEREKKVSDKPDIPKIYQEYLLKKPIETKILQVLESIVEVDKDYGSKTRTTIMIVDVGSRNGVKQGMEFHVFSPSNGSESAEIIEVEEMSSKAMIVQTIYKDTESLTPAIDWKLSTNAFK